jgi:hypothetical protein
MSKMGRSSFQESGECHHLDVSVDGNALEFN